MCPTAPAPVNQGVAIVAGHDPYVSALAAYVGMYVCVCVCASVCCCKNNKVLEMLHSLSSQPLSCVGLDSFEVHPMFGYSHHFPLCFSLFESPFRELLFHILDLVNIQGISLHALKRYRSSLYFPDQTTALQHRPAIPSLPFGGEPMASS
jgi:hypothetical protein